MMFTQIIVIKTYKINNTDIINPKTNKMRIYTYV